LGGEDAGVKEVAPVRSDQALTNFNAAPLMQ
jgi:hypothetical protein